MIHVVVTADSPVVRAGVIALIGTAPDLTAATADDDGGGDDEAQVVVWAIDGPEALNRTELSVGEEGNYDTTPSAVPRIVLLPSPDPAAVAEAVRHGALGVLPLDTERDGLTAAVRAVAAGLSVLPQEALSEILEQRGPVPAVRRRVRASLTPALTPREREVLTLLAEGLASKVISARLGISEHTVKTHVASMYEKLHSRSRAEAIVAAARHGLLVL